MPQQSGGERGEEVGGREKDDNGNNNNTMMIDGVDLLALCDNMRLINYYFLLFVGYNNISI